MTADAAVTGQIRVAIDGAVAEIALAAGPLNLVTRPLLRALNAAIVDLSRRGDLRCVIVHGGEARAFCAGSDMKEFSDLGGDASEQKILFEDMVLRNLARLPVPTIAAIDGPALGGGFELALACDLRVARAGAKLGLTESRFGGLGGSGAVRLARLVGPARAKQLLFTGEIVADDRALAWGLVNELVRDGTAIVAARDLAATVISRGPLSNRLAKQLVDSALDEPLDSALSRATVAQQAIFDSQDLMEGAAAFLEKREPVFSGR